MLSATGPINTPNNGTHNAGVVEQQRLITFWQTVANAPGVKGGDNIMFELMNEPVDIESSPGNGDWGNHAPIYFQAFRNWIQPVINAIRDTGADNVIWVPTLEWQGSPYQHAQYPFTGSNCGVAAHFYPAYGGVFDNTTALQNLWNSQYKPATDQWPIIITEMFWTPMPDDPWNLVNGTTAGFGNALKNAMDNQGNVSYLCGFLGDLLDDLNDFLPANCSLSPKEGAQAYFDWLPTYTWAAPTDRPRGLSATMIMDTQVNLIWTAVPDALSYNIKRSTTSGGPYTTIAPDIIDASFSDTNIILGLPYYYVVSANMPSGESPDSNEASAINLHAYLMFDETSGTSASDSTGNGWDGTLVDGPLWNVGQFGNAVDLDGSNDYVSLPTGVIDGLTDITISTWVYLDSISTWSRIFDFGNDTYVHMYLTPRNGSGIACFAVSTSAAAALVDDHFDDGAIGTNTTGIGTGFNYWDGQWNATVSEANSKVTLNNPVHGGSRCSITSKEGAAIGSGISRFEFRGVSFAVANNTTSGSTARNAVGVKQGNAAWDYDAGLPTGFWIQFENDSLTTAAGSGGWNGTSVLFYEANDNTKTVLATWTFDTLNWNTGIRNFTPVIDITLDISSDGYDLTIEGDTITLLSGSLAGTFASAGITNELTVSYASAYVQSENPNINISIDRIVVFGDIEEQITGVEELPTGSWTHVAVTLSGGTGILYVDGEEVGRNSSMTLMPNSLGATTNNLIGFSQFSQDPYLDGSVDDFRIYPVALSEEQVEALYKSEIPADIPSFPVNVSAAAVSISQIDLTWNAVVGATNYNIKRTETSGGPYTIITSTGGTTSFSDTGLSDSTAYYYVISAVNSLGESVDSAQVEATTLPFPPSAPMNLVATAGDDSVTLDWDANSESDLDSYNVYRSTTSGIYGAAIVTGISVNSYIDNTAVNGTVYYYVVTAVDTDTNESTYSNEVFIIPNDGSIIQLSAVDFESGMGDWVNISGEDTYDWTLDSGGTLTPNTGPDSGASGSTWYVYLETSPGGANIAGDTAILQGPMIDGYNRMFTFYYHMYGAATGTLNVDVFHDSTWHNGVWSCSGQQQTSSSEAYVQAIVNLTEYSGPIQIRFRAVAAGGPTGDMAIDNIEVIGRLLYGDMDGNDIVTLSDLLEFAESWLQENCDLDLDGDCVITLYEFTEFARNWYDDSYQN